MKHVVQFSTGAGSAEVAYRVAHQYDVDDLILLTADTRAEDPDNWRFASEVVDDLGLPRHQWIVLADGRTPMQVGRDLKCVPNNRIESPLLHPPYVGKPELLATFREIRCIEPPRLYTQGFPHANCSGACVRGGQAQWALLLRTNRAVYLDWETEEEQTRTLLDKDVSILRDRTRGTSTPLTLQRFRQQLDNQPALFDPDDWGACGCTDEPVHEVTA
jgi:hypothetical protein